MQRFSLMVLIGCSFLVGAAWAAPIQWLGNGHWYEVVTAAGFPDTGLTWDQARLAAEAAGGYLATITSAAENNFVYITVGANDPQYWILDGAGNSQGPYLGGYQPGPPPQPEADPSVGWAWVTGEPWNYTCWAVGEANNYNSNEHYLQYFYDPTYPQEPAWNDIPMYDGVLAYVVEYDVPEPVTLSLLALGGLTLLRRRTA